MKRRLSGLCIVVVALSAGQAHAAGEGTLDSVRSGGKFVIGYRESSVPFSYLGADTQPVGFSVDLCNSVAAEVKAELKIPNLKIEYAPVNASNRIPLLQNGTIDIECGSTANLPERRGQVEFSRAIFVSQGRWMVTSASKISDPRDLAGKTVVLTQGSGVIPVARKFNQALSPGFREILAKDHAEAVLTLRSGRAVGFMEEDVLLASLRANSFNPSEFFILPKVFATYYPALMIRLNDEKFKGLVNRVITRKMENGEFAATYAKWFTQPIPPAQRNLDLPMSEDLKRQLKAPHEAILPP